MDDGTREGATGTQSIEGMLLDVDYLPIEGRTRIRLVVRASDRSYDIFDDEFRPYFYFIPRGSMTERDIGGMSMRDEERSVSPTGVEAAARSVFGKETAAYRVYVQNPVDVPKLSAHMQRYGTCYEHDIPFARRYAIDKNMIPFDTYRMEVSKAKDGRLCLSGAARSGSNQNPAMNVLCFDIETYNKRGISEPLQDPVLMLSYVYASPKGSREGVITYKKIDLPFVDYVEDEEALFARFASVLDELDVDIVTGYNSTNFDISYLLQRAKALKIEFNMSRNGGDTRIEKHGLLSKVKIGGRVHVDAYQIVKFIATVGSAEHLLRLNSYTLKNVYEAISKDKKVTVEKKDIYKMWDDGGEDLKMLAQYNLNDSYALQEVYNTFVPIMIELSRTTGNVISDTGVSTTGQLCEYTMMRYANLFGEMIPNKPDEGEMQRRTMNPIEGAYVKTPEPGIYDNLVMFDFRGLYPSIIISHNIDPSSICGDCTEYYESPLGTRFDKHRKSITPTILQELINQRKEVKKLYKKSPDDLFLGAKSMALKILANSFFGYLGYARSRWYSRDCAGSITAYGRQYIKGAIDQAEKGGFEVLYGDSVAADSKVRVKMDGSIQNMAIKDLFKKVEHIDHSGKEYYYPEHLYVETLGGSGRVTLKRAGYVMRHKINKKMLRLWLTDVMHVDVTEDHSLLGFVNLSHLPKKAAADRLVVLKPDELGKKASSLVLQKRYMRSDIETRGYDKQLYELMGFFIGDGSFSYNKKGKCYYLSVAAGKEEKEIVKCLIEPLKLKGCIKNFWIKDKKGDITFNGLDTIRLFEREIKKEKGKKIPDFIFSETEENIHAFIRGLFSSDGTVLLRSNKPIIRYTTIDKNLANKIRELLLCIGISSSIFKENSQNKYNGKASGTYSYHVNIRTKDSFIKNIGFLTKKKTARIENYRETGQKKKLLDVDFDTITVKKTEVLNYKDYVYDLEVEGVHRFFANDILVHNTDSVLILLKGKTHEEAQKFLDRFNSALPGAMELELEDFYTRGVFVGKKASKGSAGAKKKYALMTKEGRIKIRGFELVRRDWSRIARETQRMVLETILKEGSPEKAAQIVKDVIARLRDGKVPMKELVINTQLRKGIDSYDSKSPELAAAKKAVQRGYRTKHEMEHSVIGYIITKSGSTISDKAELEELAKDYDPDYYINNQVIPATMRILRELDFKEEELTGAGKQAKL